VAGDERLRLFCALRLPDDTIDALVDWQRRELGGSAGHGTRLVPRENLHVTLAFLGATPAGELPAVAAALRAAAAEARELRLRVRDYRETRSVGMLTLDDEGGRVTALAVRLHDGLEAAGVFEREARPWLPHLTVLRFRERPRLRPVPPELGVVVPSDASVFLSKLRPGGARYEVLEAVALAHSEGGR
jgi:2'-5' RNA ligase